MHFQGEKYCIFFSFRPVSDGVINLYLYNFGSNLGVALILWRGLAIYGLKGPEKALKLHFQGEKYCIFFSFRPVSDGVINLYLYNFGSNLGVALILWRGPSNLWVKRP